MRQTQTDSPATFERSRLDDRTGTGYLGRDTQFAFRQTDTNGTFAISWSGDYKDSLFLDFRLLGYETVRIKPPFDGDMTIHLKEDNIELPEVKVNAQKMEIKANAKQTIPSMI